MHYFLAEDAVEVIAVDKRSDDSAPKLLGKRKLLLPEYQHSVNTPTTKTNTYHWTDLASDSASRRVEAPSLHSNASSPGEEAVGGFFFDFEPFRTVSSEYDAPRRRCARSSP